jgi:hypothetical protein
MEIYKTIILSAVLYGCEKRYFMLREGYILRVFENRMLRGMFVPKREEVTGSWRNLHKEKLHNTHSSSDITRIVKSRKIR